MWDKIDFNESDCWPFTWRNREFDGADMTEYYLVRATSQYTFEVAKFDGGKAPKDVYHIRLPPSGITAATCSCPGYSRVRRVAQDVAKHKHIALVLAHANQSKSISTWTLKEGVPFLVMSHPVLPLAPLKREALNKQEH